MDERHDHSKCVEARKASPKPGGSDGVRRVEGREALETKGRSRNHPCACGSGRKVKKCCGLVPYRASDETVLRDREASEKVVDADPKKQALARRLFIQQAPKRAAARARSECKAAEKEANDLRLAQARQRVRDKVVAREKRAAERAASAPAPTPTP